MSAIKKNQFKAALKDSKTQIGLWLGLANSYTAEIVANTGFDWLLIDGEHAPNTIPTVLQQLQAIAPYASHAVVRPPIGEEVAIKHLLDIGAQTLLIPMVESAQQAKKLVQETRYPPEGIRGVGTALARAALWNTVDDYLDKANDEICLLVQVENVEGLHNIDKIAAVEGVDGVFIGPADLSAAMGYRGKPTHPDVQAAIADGLKKIKAAGKAAGILFADVTMAKKYIEMGFDFVAVGVDTTLLTKACKELVGQFKTVPVSAASSQPSVY